MIIWEKDSCLIVLIQLGNKSGWNYSVFRYPFNVNQSFLRDNLFSIVFTCKTDFMECVASRTCMIPTRYNFQLSRLRNSKQLIFLLLSAAHSPLIEVQCVTFLLKLNIWGEDFLKAKIDSSALGRSSSFPWEATVPLRNCNGSKAKPLLDNTDPSPGLFVEGLYPFSGMKVLTFGYCFFSYVSETFAHHLGQ